MLRRLLTTFVATVLLATATAGAAGHAAATATTSHGCTDVRQIGRTAYVRWHGMTIFSVKQYASPTCGLRFGYAYAWRQFRLRHVPYELGVAVFDSTHDRYLGARQFASGGGPAFWSTGVTTTRGACTQAIVEVWPPNDDLGAVSTKVC
jgi:hypothetical protein